MYFNYTAGEKNADHKNSQSLLIGIRKEHGTISALCQAATNPQVERKLHEYKMPGYRCLPGRSPRSGNGRHCSDTGLSTSARSGRRISTWEAMEQGSTCYRHRKSELGWISMYTGAKPTRGRIMDYQPAKLVSGFVVIMRKPVARSLARWRRVVASRRLAFVRQSVEADLFNAARNHQVGISPVDGNAVAFPSCEGEKLPTPARKDITLDNEEKRRDECRVLARSLARLLYTLLTRVCTNPPSTTLPPSA